MATVFLVLTVGACVYLLYALAKGWVVKEVRASPGIYAGITAFCAIGCSVRIDRIASNVAQPYDVAFAAMLGFIVLIFLGAFLVSRRSSAQG